jgi:hypothetical protein
MTDNDWIELTIIVATAPKYSRPDPLANPSMRRSFRRSMITSFWCSAGDAWIEYLGNAYRILEEPDMVRTLLGADELRK